MHKLLGIGLILMVIGMLAPSVWGDAFLVDPLVQKAKPNGELDVGKISPGERLEIIVSTDSGYGKEAPWTQARLGEASPNGGIQTTNSGVGTKSLIMRVQTTALTPEGTYRIPLTLVGEAGELNDETYTIVFGIQKQLVRGSLSATQVSGRVNEPSVFRVLLVNDSSTPAPLRVEPTLPFTWSAPRDVTLDAHAFQTIDVQVTPRFAGPKSFDIKVVRTDNGTVVETLTGTLMTEPTLKDRYAAGLYGFPFFTISLVAHYLTNALASLVL